MKTDKVLVTEDGWHCREENPFDNTKFFQAWEQFEATVKTYDLTKQCEPGSVVTAELVWYVKYDKQYEISPHKPNKYTLDNYECKEFYSPIPITDADKIVSEPEDENRTPFEEYLDAVIEMRDKKAKDKPKGQLIPLPKKLHEFAHETAFRVVNNEQEYTHYDIKMLAKQMIIAGANWQTTQNNIIDDKYPDPPTISDNPKGLDLKKLESEVDELIQKSTAEDYLKIMDKPKEETVEEAALSFNAEHPENYFNDFDPKYKELHKAIDDLVTKVGYKEFAFAVLKYQGHNLSQYQLQKTWK